MSREPLYHFLSEYIKKYSGITYLPANFFQLDARIETLKKQAGIQSDEDLLKMLKSSIPSDLHLLIIDLATNNETFFFRDFKLWDRLEKTILPEIIKRKKEISVWSLACSTGQEIYSFLMTCARLGNASLNLKIDASDISPRVLARAKSGLFSQLEVQRGLPIQELQKHFKLIGENQWEIRQDWCSMINFSEFNLITSPYPRSKHDIIFCRNVLIYQNVEKRREILHKLENALSPNGYLILGNSENLIGVYDGLNVMHLDGVVVFQKQTLGTTKAS